MIQENKCRNTTAEVLLQCFSLGSEHGKEGQDIRDNMKEELVKGLVGESLMRRGYQRWL